MQSSGNNKTILIIATGIWQWHARNSIKTPKNCFQSCAQVPDLLAFSSLPMAVQRVISQPGPFGNLSVYNQLFRNCQVALQSFQASLRHGLPDYATNQKTAFTIAHELLPDLHFQNYPCLYNQVVSHAARYFRELSNCTSKLPSKPYSQVAQLHDTSSTAQGGGGSFKNRKPIGEVGCCESGMAERSHR